jgi:hypothetical protein
MQHRGEPIYPLSALALAVTSLLGSAAQAQQLEEIIVTAERRELNLQDTPISVMSFEGEALELRGVDDMFDLALRSHRISTSRARAVPATRRRTFRSAASAAAAEPRASAASVSISTTSSCRARRAP